MSTKAAAGIMGVGGLLVAVGTFLPLASAFGTSISYFETPDGKLVLGIGVALVIFAVGLGVSTSRGLSIAMGVLGLIAGALGVVSIVIDWQSLGDAGLSAGVGVYVTLLGSVVGVVGAVMAFRAPKPEAVGTPPPPPPPSTEAPPPPA